MRNLSYLYRKKLSAKMDLAVSANVAYKDVNLKDEDIEGDYENPAGIVLKPSEQWTQEDEATIYSTILCTTKPPASECTGIDEQL